MRDITSHGKGRNLVTNKEKIEKIKELMKEFPFMEETKTPDEIFMMMKEYPMYDIAETVAEFAVFYNELRKVVEE